MRKPYLEQAREMNTAAAEAFPGVPVTYLPINTLSKFAQVEYVDAAKAHTLDELQLAVGDLATQAELDSEVSRLDSALARVQRKVITWCIGTMFIGALIGTVIARLLR